MEIKYETNDPDIMGRCVTPNGEEILVVTAPSSSIDGGIGPVIMPGFDSDHILVVFSEEYVMSMAPQAEDSLKEISEKMRFFANTINEGVKAGLQWMAQQ